MNSGSSRLEFGMRIQIQNVFCRRFIHMALINYEALKSQITSPVIRCNLQRKSTRNNPRIHLQNGRYDIAFPELINNSNSNLRKACFEEQHLDQLPFLSRPKPFMTWLASAFLVNSTYNNEYKILTQQILKTCLRKSI